MVTLNHHRRDTDVPEFAIPPWVSKAACGPPTQHLFHAPDTERAPDRRHREAKAKAVCGLCPVQALCLDYSLEQSVRDKNWDGIWGGLNDSQRYQLAGQRGLVKIRARCRRGHDLTQEGATRWKGREQICRQCEHPREQAA